MAKICRVLLLAFLLNACWTPSVADAEVGDLKDSRYSPGGRHIIALLSSYMSGSCDEARKFAAENVDATQGLALTPGENHIMNLLSSYFSSGCKVDAKAAAVVHDSRYSPGENQIIKLLSAYISSGCKGAAETAKAVETTEDPRYSLGEIQIIKLLSSYISSDCKAIALGSEELKNTLPESGAIGRHVHFCALEWFLPIAGVCLTWIIF